MLNIVRFVFVALVLGRIDGSHIEPAHIYDGFQLWELEFSHESQQKSISDLIENKKVILLDEYRFPPSSSQALISSAALSHVLNLLATSGVKYRILYNDVQSVISEWKAEKRRRYSDPDAYTYDRDQYNTYEDIMLELDNLAGKCPSEFSCSVKTIGFSYEGREIKVFQIEKSNENRPIVFLDSLTHAAEWLSGATVMRLLHKIVEEYESDAAVARLLQTYDFYVLPVTNPDGYAYTWETGNSWRKNRRPNPGNPDCPGIDLNRNYDNKWSVESSDSPCSGNYHGPSPASEPETQAVQGEANRIGSRVTTWVSYHCRGRAWLLPWGHRENGTCQYPDDYEDLYEAGKAAIDAIMTTGGEDWTVGASCPLFYPNSGTTKDYVKAVSGVKYSQTPELRSFGFGPLSRVDDIQPSYAENWTGLVALLDQIEIIEGRK